MTGEGRQRADVLLVAKGLAPSRARAAMEIKAGRIFADGAVVSKPGALLAANVRLELKAASVPYVSRGGLKLAHALDQFAIDPTGLTALDLGASTGGFTDVLLRRGAARVYAADVGHGQLHDSLRADARVVALDGLNARDITRTHVPDLLDLIVCDVSFISLTLALPAPLTLAGAGARLITLIKPQFEAGRDLVGKNGVVKDPAVHTVVCERITDFIAGQSGWRVHGLTQSPIKGPSGNREFLLAASKT